MHDLWVDIPTLKLRKFIHKTPEKTRVVRRPLKLQTYLFFWRLRIGHLSLAEMKTFDSSKLPHKNFAKSELLIPLERHILLENLSSGNKTAPPSRVLRPRRSCGYACWVCGLTHSSACLISSARPLYTGLLGCEERKAQLLWYNSRAGHGGRGGCCKVLMWLLTF